MADQLDVLKQLQGIDGELFRLRRQQEEKPRELEAVNAQLAAQDARVKTVEERVKAVQMAQKQKEMDLQAREANVKKLQGQLFQLKTNKEYAAMQREIESLKTDNSLMEEAILKGFDEIDQATQGRKREEAQLGQVRERAAAERQRIERELAQIGERIAQLERDRKLLAPNVLAEILAAYERVLVLREGLALVPLVDESCGGCHRRLPPQVVNQVHLKAKLVSCESCNRILYLDDAQSRV